MSTIDNIYQVFIDYFGEDKVDKQSYSSSNPIELAYVDSWANSTIILVHWPVVTVTNEFDAHIDIWDLYAATLIDSNGRLKNPPFFIRSTYDLVQWNSSYLHSHVASINKTNLHQFQRSCLGSGPINATIEKLKENFFTDMDIWRLYCWELDKYVSVESLSGVPYKKLQSVGVNSDGTFNGVTQLHLQPNIQINILEIKAILRNFIPYILKKNILRFAYSNGNYSLATPYVSTVLHMSNAFIELYNNSNALRNIIDKESLFQFEVIKEMHIVNGIIYYKEDSNIPIETVVGENMFVFKEKPVVLQLKDYQQSYESSKVYLLNPLLVDYIICTLLKYVNISYGKGTDFTNKKIRVV